MSAATLDARARELVTPGAAMEERIRAFLRAQLGHVLPPQPARGLDWYYDWVILGGRSLEAYRILLRHRPSSELPVLDVGCGVGTFVLLANRLGMPAIGVEPGGEELELARDRAAASESPELAACILDGVGEALPLADESCSAVLLHDVLEHVGDWRAVLAECRRVLAPGGVVYVKGPSYSVRFVEPHYRVLWLPLMPKSLARAYLRLRGREVSYLEHLGWRRRGAVLAELRGLGLELTFPRHEKLRNPGAINRRWARALARPVLRSGNPPGWALRLADNPLQSTIDVVARRPGGVR